MSVLQRLGKYQITGVLGEGAMGVVYRGFDPDIRRVVALKTIRRESDTAGSAAESAARFRNEAQAAGRLQHPGIVGVHDFGDDGRVAYIAMEYVEGHTLARYLAQGVRFSDADIASLGTQLLAALAHAHEHGVWHRDIKPSNVIMTRNGRAKIADFGIARTDTSALTQTQSVLGTPMYMAPEQFMGLPIDHRVDLYGVGVLLYQLVAGRPPFVGPPQALMYRVVNETPVPPSSVEGEPRSALFDAATLTALAKQPQQRHPSAAAFIDALAQAWGQPVPEAVSREAIAALPAAGDYAPTERILPAAASIGTGTGTSIGAGQAPGHWEAAVLAQVEAALARHVGPLAGVLVRRAARECHDLPELFARLAPQVTPTAAREVFMAQLARTGAGAGSGSGTGTGTGTGSVTVTVTGTGSDPAPRPIAAAPPTGGSAGRSDPVSQAWIEQAEKLLAAQVGPIARVLVRREATRTRLREPLVQGLVEALNGMVPEPARVALEDALARLR